VSRCSKMCEQNLLDHVVGRHLHDQRHGEAKRFRCPKVHDNFVLNRYLHRKLDGLRSPQDTINIGGRATKKFPVCPLRRKANLHLGHG
jgi:hypothetical protein